MIETNFKHTDIGLIPHDWEVKTLEESAQRVSVGLATSVTQYYTRTGVPMFRNLNIKENRLDDSDILFLEEAFANANPTKKIHKDDVLTVHTGYVGISCVVPEKYEGALTFTTLITTTKRDALSPNYLSMYLNSNMGMNEVALLQAGGGRNNLNVNDFVNLRIPLPPTTAEQERIAEALSSIDCLISSLGEQIEKKRLIKQGVMQQLLTGKTRLNGFTGEWLKRHIWEVTIWDKKFNGVEEYKQPETRKYPYVLAKELLSMQDNKGNVVLLSTGSYCGWTTEERAGRFLCEGEVVTIPWGGVAIVKYTKGRFVTADNRLATSNNVQLLSNKFLYLALLIRTDTLNSFYRGASIKHPSMEDVLNLEIAFPPTIEEQNSIANILTSMDDEIAALEQKRDKYIAIKSGMMQQLLTGKIRLI